MSNSSFKKKILFMIKINIKKILITPKLKKLQKISLTILKFVKKFILL